MKFGGTSVEDAAAIDRVASIVKARLAERPFVVVSAMAKVTDQLLAMAAAAGRGDREQALDICRSSARAPLHHRRRAAGHRAAHRPAHRAGRRVRLARRAAARHLPPSASSRRAPPTTWSPSASGLSSMIATPAFLARDIPATLVDARQVIITDAQHSRAVPQVDEINDRLQDRVKPLIEQRPRAGHGRLHRRDPRRRAPPPLAAAAPIFPPRWSAPD